MNFRWLLLVLSLGLLFGGPCAHACPFCSAPQLTLAEQIAQSDAAVVAEWVKGTVPDFDAGTPGSTTYRVETIIKSPDTETVQKEAEITVDEYFPGEKGHYSLIIGSEALSVTKAQQLLLLWNNQVLVNNAIKLNWSTPLDISLEGVEYVANAPGPENDPALRLRYFVKFLEAKDPLVADDAYAEFANAPYETIASISDAFPTDKVRKWVFSEETAVTRLGLYGLMLGLCGKPSDIPTLKEKVIANDVDFRLGIDGVMAGYLLLGGAEALTVLEETKLKPSLKTPSPVPFSETFATLQALKFMWEYTEGRIEPDRLRASMRVLLKHPDLADLVIIDLARWQDWTLLEELKQMYGQEPFDVPAIKRAIVGYLIACQKQKPQEESMPIPAFVTEAEAYLTQLEETDPKTVKTARLLFR